jgi:UDP-glucose 4-epimerase
MKYVVTGGAGFVGSNLVDQLIMDGHEVHVIDNFCSSTQDYCNKKAHYHDLDVSDVNLNSSFLKIMKNADGVFHMAALINVQESIENPFKYEINNTLGTLNMLTCSSRCKVKRFVYSSSSAVYGNTDNLPCKESHSIDPISPYATQKYYGELLCKMFSEVYNLETISLRYFNIYGERQKITGAYAPVIGIFISQILNNQPMTIRGDGEQRRDFIYVGDVVSANILSMSPKKVGFGQVMNIGTGKNYSVNEIADMIDGDKVNVNPVTEPRESLACTNKAKELLNWEPKNHIRDWIKIYKEDLGI